MPQLGFGNNAVEMHTTAILEGDEFVINSEHSAACLVRFFHFTRGLGWNAHHSPFEFVQATARWG